MTALQELIPWIENETIDPHAIDRRPLARSKAKAIGDEDSIWEIVRKSRSLANSLGRDASESLSQHTVRLRTHVLNNKTSVDDEVLCLAAAGVIEAVKRVLGFRLFDVQLFAGVATTRGAVAEMQTGEGKTLAGILPAYFHALAGRGVHVATTNSYLASRDREGLDPVFCSLGMTTGLVAEDSGDEDARHAYDADVTFGPGHVFGFDFLKDQRTLASDSGTELGNSIYQRVNRISSPSRSLQRRTRGRGLYCGIIDEIDNVLIDDAVSPLLLSESSEAEAVDSEIHRRANAFARSMRDKDFKINRQRNEVTFSESSYEEMYEHTRMAAHDQLVRPWHEYIALALRAIHCLKRDIDYVIRDKKVQIVDASTGRVFADRTWSRGLHQAVLANEGLPITPESKTLARITRQRFFRHYQVLAGMTGTGFGCEKEFASVYGLPVVQVPLRLPSRRHLLDGRLFRNETEKLDGVVEEVIEMNKLGRAVLVGTHSIQQSLAIAERLNDAGLVFQLLNGVQDADEATVVSNAGQFGAITVATNLAGRGTDIKLDERVAELGGLHVILAQPHALSRVDRQLIGRCARCGDPGSARTFVSGDDAILQQNAPWIERAIHRLSDRQHDATPMHPMIQRDIAGSQQDCERRAAHARWSMLRADREMESLMSGASQQNNMSNACWRLS